MELSLSLLGQEYDDLLMKYEQAYKNYIDHISSSASSSSSLSTLNGRTYWGTEGISEGASSTLEECSARCSSLSTCTGATFNPDKKYCWARKGEGEVMPGLDSDVAIIPKTKEYSDVLYKLNTQLIDLNKKMIDITATSMPELNKEK